MAQITFLDSVDKKIAQANSKKCENCRAMKHADTVAREEEKKRLIEEWKAANGITDEDKDEDDDSSRLSWTGIFKKLLV